MARKHTRNEQEMLELISDGNVTLMHAVDKFDFTRGTKFSTYATWAVVKRFATRRRRQAREPVLDGLESFDITDNGRIPPSKVTAREAARRRLGAAMASTLQDHEQRVVQAHYGLEEKTSASGTAKGKSFSQIGKLVGLSKERIRQIEKAALAKLRAVLTPEQFDAIIET